METFKVTFKAESKVVFEVKAESTFKAKEIALKEMDKMVDYQRNLKTDNRVTFIQPLILTKMEKVYYPIMDTSSYHNALFVQKINDLWNSDKHDSFKNILIAYMLRDLEEMFDKNIFEDDIDVDYKHLNEHWETLAEYYLMRVADDGDLAAIINYIR